MKNQRDILNEKILLLQHKQTEDLDLLKGHFHIMYQNIQPINFIENTLQEVTSVPEINNHLLDNVIGLTTGYLSKKVLVGATHNPLKQMLGALLQFTIANLVAKHTDTIKLIGGNLIQRIFGQKRR